MLNEAYDLLTETMLDDAMENAIEAVQDGIADGIEASELVDAFKEAITNDPLLISRLRSIEL